ncbi:MAG: M15 family metallopeptidase [Burkholderia gladioli]
MINSRSLSDLLPPVRARAQAFLDACAKQGIDILVTSMYRDLDSQAALYAQGRTSPGRIVTNARPGQSFHNFRVAFDFVPIVNGKCDWSDLSLFTRCGAIGESVGLTWAGRWTTFREMAHLQYTGGLTFAQLAAGRIPDDGASVATQSAEVPA